MKQYRLDSISVLHVLPTGEKVWYSEGVRVGNSDLTDAELENSVKSNILSEIKPVEEKKKLGKLVAGYKVNPGYPGFDIVRTVVVYDDKVVFHFRDGTFETTTDAKDSDPSNYVRYAERGILTPYKPGVVEFVQKVMDEMAVANA